MSIAVSLDELFAQLSSWGPAALLTVGDHDNVRVVTLIPIGVDTADGRRLRLHSPGRTATANVAARPAVTLYFAPRPGSDAMSLIVDGTASVDSSGDYIDVEPTSAIQHRPAPNPSTPHS